MVGELDLSDSQDLPLFRHEEVDCEEKAYNQEEMNFLVLLLLDLDHVYQLEEVENDRWSVVCIVSEREEIK